MSYAKRTCHKCGIRKPQPEMTRKKTSTLSVSTNPQRKKSTRLYTRNKEVWECSSCGNSGESSTLVIWVVALVVATLIYGGDIGLW